MIKGLKLNYLFDPEFVRLMGPPDFVFFSIRYSFPSTQEALFTQCWFNIGHRFQRWPDIKPTLVRSLMSEFLTRKTRGIEPMLFYYWPTVYDAGPTLSYIGWKPRVSWSANMAASMFIATITNLPCKRQVGPTNTRSRNSKHNTCIEPILF